MAFQADIPGIAKIDIVSFGNFIVEGEPYVNAGIHTPLMLLWVKVNLFDEAMTFSIAKSGHLGGGVPEISQICQ